MDLYNLVVSAKLSKGGGGDEPVLIDKTITENGTYNASSDSADGYKKVAVNVPSVAPTGNINITSTAQTDVSAYATAQVVDADLVASNIKKDVDILGVVGTYEGGGGGGGGAEIETGTWDPSANDVRREFIPFANSHSKLPAIIILTLLQDSADTWSNSYVTKFQYTDLYQLYGKGFNISNSTTDGFGYSLVEAIGWTASDTSVYKIMTSHNSSEAGDADKTYPRYFVNESGFYATANFKVTSLKFVKHIAGEWHWVAIWV